MNLKAKPIEVLAWFDAKGQPHLVRFRINIDEEQQVIVIRRVLKCDLEKPAGNHMLVFTCESEINGQLKRFIIKYELGTCKWILFKM